MTRTWEKSGSLVLLQEDKLQLTLISAYESIYITQA
jgi:hypothetical protein